MGGAGGTEVKVVGAETDMTIEFAESKPGVPTEKITTATPTPVKYNARDGKLPLAHWCANKDIPLHWHAAIRAHLRLDDGHEIDEATVDKALEEVKALKIG